MPHDRVSQLLTNHYEQNWKYYCLPSGWGSYGQASEEELLLTKKIFWGIFDSLSQKVKRFGQWLYTTIHELGINRFF